MYIYYSGEQVYLRDQSVDGRNGKDSRDNMDDADHKEIPIVGRWFFQVLYDR